MARGGPLREEDLLHIPPGRALTIGHRGGCDAVFRSTQLCRVHALVVFTPALGACLPVDRHRATWLTRLAVRLYPDGRHELLHQTNRAELIGALLDWFDAVISGGAAPPGG